MKIWGLDIGSTGIKVIKLAYSWKGFRIVSYGYYPFSSQQNPTEEKRLILDKIFSPRAKRENVILSFPSQRTIVHRLSLPFTERKKNEQVIKLEVESFLPFPIEEIVADFFPAKNYKGERASLAFVASKEDIAAELSSLTEVGLDPESLIPEAVSLFWLARFLKKTDTPGALLDLGAEKATLVIWQDGGLALTRSLPLSGKEENNCLRRLSGELQRTLMAYESDPRNSKIDKIWLTGGLIHREGIREKLTAELPKTVDLLDLAEEFPSLKEEVPEKYHHSLAVALGSTLWESAEEEEHLNLRREEFASPKKTEKARSRISLTITYGIIWALLGLAVLGTNYYLKESKYRELKTQIRHEFLQAYPGVKKVVNEVQQMKNLLQEERIKTGTLGGKSKGGAPLEVIYEISAAVEPDWKIRITELIMEAEAVEIAGEADSFETANRLKSKLDNSNLFKEGQLKVVRASSLENIIEFKIQMKKKG